MAKAKTHAKRSPSGAEQRKLCPGSVVLQEGREDWPSRYSAEGTAAHELMELCLTEDKLAEAYAGRILEADGFEFEVNGEMIDAVNNFLDYVKNTISPGHGDVLLVEQQVPIGHISGEQDATGTADVVGFVDGKRLVVIDLKYGRGVRVEAEYEEEDELTGETVKVRNEQLMYYAAGALEENELLFDIEMVTVAIMQPRLEHIAEIELTVDELREEVERLREIERRCDEAEAATVGYAPPMDLPEGWAETYLRPSEDACRFCKAKATCPALRGEVIDLVGTGAAVSDDFADLEVATAEDIRFVADMHDDKANWLGNLMSKIGMVEDWCKAVRAEVEAELFAGRPVPGYKLVQGKQGNRAWKDEVEATAAMKASRLKVDEMFDQKLISPTKAEKLLKDRPRVWKKLAELVTRSEGQPSVAPESDKRPALDLAAGAEDFDLVVADDGGDLV